MRVRPRPAFAAAGVLAILVVVGLSTLRDYGLTFDEPIRARSGDDWWHYVATRDAAYVPQGWFANLGAWFDMLGSAAARLYRAFGGQDEYLARHALVFGCGIVGIAGTFALARRVLSPWLAVVAMVLLALAPRYYGACFNNPKDIPFAAAFVWAMFGVVRLLQEPSRRSAIIAGILAGVCTGVRPFGAVFILLGGLACAWPLVETPARERRVLLGLTVAVGLIASTALWPILWVRGPWFLLSALSATPEGTVHEFFGKIYKPADSPASYAAVWLAITLPLPTLLLAAAGTTHLAAIARRTPRRRAFWVGGLLALWILVPVMLPGLRHMPMYSAARHFVFVLPGLCLLAACGCERLAGLMKERWQLAAAGVVVLASYADVLATEVRLHPYEDLYFSRLVGGIKGAAGSFDVAYYGETYREAFEWLAANATAPVHVNTVGGRLSVDVPAYYAARFGMVFDGPDLQYFVSQVRAHREDDLPGEVVHTVSRGGVPLAVVVRVAKMETPASAWTDGPWRPVQLRDGKLDLDSAGSLVALSFESPKEQTVDLYWGYLGGSEIALTSLHPPRKVDLPRLGTPMYPGMIRTPIPFVSGANVILVQTSELERGAGLFLSYRADAGLTAGPGPGTRSPRPGPAP